MSRTQPHVRADIYSFDPPIEGMNRKNFMLNDIFFPKPPVTKGRAKYTVSLPSKTNSSTSKSGSGPVVNLPSKLNPGNSGAFGRKSDAASVSNWRKPSSSPLTAQPSVNENSPQVLETVSRSPPPESSSVKATVPNSQSPTVSVTGSAKQQQRTSKMPVGADVAFYRDSRAGDSKEEGVTVKFIVSSELEEESSTAASTGERVVSKVDDVANASSLDSKKESTGDMAAYSPARSNNMPWPKSPKALHTKDSPSRAPDPEHLRAVWSSTSNKAEAPSVNSLAKIADDLGAVPFTIQEVKSEDGGTPPPPSSGPPSRMSSYDVTRAFQQVPTPSVSSSTSRSGHLSNVSSPPTTHRQPHPPNPVPTPNMRPMYPGYGSPMMSSPSQSMVYPMSMTPSPRPMVPTAQQYPQPMWMGPPPPGTMMRSPYMTQLMPYPPPPGYPPPQNMQGGMHPPPQPNGTPGRPNGLPLISPVLAHAHASPMYTPSPVLMHAQAVPPPHNHNHTHPYPNPGQPPRQGQPPRAGYDHHSHPGGPYAHTPSHPHPPQGALYNAVPSNSFDRPSW
ncbi:hypothetical protein QCA50_001554 [Cerrena zonata]|uniref:Uncharacterized protein n=1 Tax=Cerrena zonata TaxID=2478898 RepID=A0AAW0GV64_9APHY